MRAGRIDTASGKVSPARHHLRRPRLSRRVELDLAHAATAGLGHELCVQADVGVVDGSVRSDRHARGTAAGARRDQGAQEGAVGVVLADGRTGAVEPGDDPDVPVAVRGASQPQRGDQIRVGDEGRFLRDLEPALGGAGRERRREARHASRRGRLGDVYTVFVDDDRARCTQAVVQNARLLVRRREVDDELAVPTSLAADRRREQPPGGVEAAADRVADDHLIGPLRKRQLLQQCPVGREDSPPRSRRGLAGVVPENETPRSVAERARLAVDRFAAERDQLPGVLRRQVVHVESIVLGAEQRLSLRSGATSVQGLVHGEDQLVDGNEAVEVVVDRLAAGDTVAGQGDLNRKYQLVDRDQAIAVAVADAGGRAPARQSEQRHAHRRSAPRFVRPSLAFSPPPVSDAGPIHPRRGMPRPVRSPAPGFASSVG